MLGALENLREGVMIQVNRTVKHKVTGRLYRIVEVGPDWLDCKANKRTKPQRFLHKEVELYTSPRPAVGMFRTILTYGVFPRPCPLR